jgi:hypothetical protein
MNLFFVCQGFYIYRGISNPYLFQGHPLPGGDADLTEPSYVIVMESKDVIKFEVRVPLQY